MKHIKYILFSILIILFTTSKVLAITASDPCYYMSDDRDFKAKLVVYTGVGFKYDFNLDAGDLMDLQINKIGAFSPWIKDSETIINWAGSGKTTSKGDTDKVKFTKLYDSLEEASINGTCPAYLVFQHCSQYKVWGTNNPNMANDALDAIKSNPKCVGYKAQFKNSAGVKYTAEDYYGSAELKQRIEGADIELNCSNLFGDKNDAGEKDADGNVVRSASIAYIITSVLTYVRIIAPILVILLGMLDLAKAVVASKEDQMKKAQSDFIK